MKHYVTPHGFNAMLKEFKTLSREERPKLVETVRWAASNGDRSENGDYIYGKKRLREIDRRTRYLNKQIENAIVVDPQTQQQLTQVFFGATVTYENEQTNEKITIKIVGKDEALMEKNKISYISPVAKALLKAKVDDEVMVNTPSGKHFLMVLEISYV
jgi:transcription elongation factor GreB